MKHFISLATLLIAAQITIAQTEKINLSDYKLPEMKRHQLDLNVNSNGSMNIEKMLIDFELYPDTLVKSNYRSFSGNSSFGYQFFRNTSAIQASLYSGVNFSGNLQKKDNESTSVYQKKSYDGGLNLNSEIFLFNKKNWFLMGGANGYYTFSNYNESEYQQDYSSSGNVYRARLDIGAGKGRIEQVQDYRHALLLLHEFEKRNVLTREVTSEESLELANLVSKLKNERVFDSRLRKEDDLTAIDSFLSESGLVSEKSISYFTGLEDIWGYGSGDIRKSGKQWFISVAPMINRQNSNISTSEQTHYYKASGIRYKLSYEDYNPISLKWQANYRFDIIRSNVDNIEKLIQSEETKTKEFEINASTSGEIGFYPDTRTYAGLSATMNLFNHSNERALDNNNYGAQLLFLFETYYYFSPQLKMNLSAWWIDKTYHIFNKDIPNSHSDNFNYQLTVSYAIF